MYQLSSKSDISAIWRSSEHCFWTDPEVGRYTDQILKLLEKHVYKFMTVHDELLTRMLIVFLVQESTRIWMETWGGMPYDWSAFLLTRCSCIRTQTRNAEMMNSLWYMRYKIILIARILCHVPEFIFREITYFVFWWLTSSWDQLRWFQRLSSYVRRLHWLTSYTWICF